MNKVVDDSKVLTKNSDGCVRNRCRSQADVTRQDDNNERPFE